MVRHRGAGRHAQAHRRQAQCRNRQILRNGEKFAAQGVDAIGSTVEQFQAHLQTQRTMWAKVVKDAGVTPE